MQTLDLNEAARLLHIHPVTLLKKAKSGEVPAAKPGKCWVFIDVDLQEYLRSQYFRQASQSDTLKEKVCHSTGVKTPRIGGSKSLSVVGKYKEALKLQTERKPSNLKRLSKRNSGSNKS